MELWRIRELGGLEGVFDGWPCLAVVCERSRMEVAQIGVGRDLGFELNAGGLLCLSHGRWGLMLEGVVGVEF